MFRGILIPEHSQIVREALVANTDNTGTLQCVSDFENCCTDSENSWYFDFPSNDDPGRHVHLESAGFAIYQARDRGVVRLHFNSTGGNTDSEGVFLCRIWVAAGSLQDLFVGIYPTVSDDRGQGTPNDDGECITLMLVWGELVNSVVSMFRLANITTASTPSSAVTVFTVSKSTVGTVIC